MVVVVEIIDHSVRKPFLGGWKDIRTQTEYHNAATQTRPRKSKVPWDSLKTRDTQTTVLIDKVTEISLEKGSQTSDNGVHMPSVTDKFILAGKFESAEVKNCFQDGAARRRYLEAFAVKIQKFYRAYRTRSMIRHFAAIFRNMVRTNASFYRAFQEQYGNRRQLQIIKSTSPRTRDDFEMLYNLVDCWRIGEIQRANQVFMKCSRMAAHAMILRKEIELLRAIDRIKAEVKKVQAEKRNVEFLNRWAKPITWTGYKGCTVSMETLRVQKAKHYKRLYESLSDGDSTTEERLNLLLRMRESLKSHNCEAVLEITYLIDQELRLLSQNIHQAMLDHLRSRLKFAFLYFVRSETFCGIKCLLEQETMKFEERPPTSISSTTSHLSEINFRLCGRCGKLLPITRFGLNRHQRISICFNCQMKTPKSSIRPVNEPYEEMLRMVRKQEASSKAFDSVAFIIGLKGVGHLVNVIWHGKSGISECSDIHQLALVRFQRDTAWAPWNTLVLTKREAKVHANLEDPNRVYSKNLMEKFIQKNVQARLTFKSLDIFCTTSSNCHEDRDTCTEF